MNIKRIVSGLILFPIAAAILIFGNQYVVDATVALIAIMSIHEFYKAFRTGEKANPVSWVGYATAAMISLIHVLPDGWILKTIGLLLPISLCILFLYVIITAPNVPPIHPSIVLFGLISVK